MRSNPMEALRTPNVESFLVAAVVVVSFLFQYCSYVKKLACTLLNFCLVFRNGIYVIASGWLLYVYTYISIHIYLPKLRPALLLSLLRAGHWPLTAGE